MRTCGRPVVLLASLSLAGFSAAGCASRQANSPPSPAPPTRTSLPSGAVNTYHAGEPCPGRSEPLYAAAGLTCVTGRLQRASATRYHAGQFCSGRTESIYAAAGLKCVQGRLKAS